MTSFESSTTITFMSCVQYYNTTRNTPGGTTLDGKVLLCTSFLEMKGFLTTQRILRLAKGFFYYEGILSFLDNGFPRNRNWLHRRHVFVVPLTTIINYNCSSHRFTLIRRFVC